MFKQILIPSFLLLSFSLTAQKKELKSIDKLITNEDYDSAKEQLIAVQAMVENADVKYKIQYQFLAGKIYGHQKDYKAAFDALALAKALASKDGSSKYKAEIDLLVNTYSNDAINLAVEENQNENYSTAADLLYMVYNVDVEQNMDYLYYAASSAVNGGDFDRALNYYQVLKEKNYTGSVEKFYATKSDTGEEVELSAETYVLFQKQKD